MRAKRILLLGGLVVAGAVAGGWLWGGDLRAGVDAVMAVLRTAGPGVFFTGMALLPLVGFPLAPFTFAAGPVFAPQLGVTAVIACALGAVTVNVALGYWISAQALRPLMQRLMQALGRTLPQATASSGWQLTLFVRVIPGTPFFVQSYLLGIARVPFLTYLSISVAVMAALIAGTILAGDAWMRGDRTVLIASGMGCALVGLGMHLLRRKLMHKLRASRSLKSGAAAGAAGSGDTTAAPISES
jgi:uncharacterized membrane protein YdjX (TVP38/TMEM64 family)